MKEIIKIKPKEDKVAHSSLDFEKLKGEFLLFLLHSLTTKEGTIFFCSKKASNSPDPKVVKIYNHDLEVKAMKNICDCIERILQNFDGKDTLMEKLHVTRLGVIAFLSCIEEKYKVSWSWLPPPEQITFNSLLSTT